ncbi:hypothetical protein D3C78_952820 [compost metagenome]
MVDIEAGQQRLQRHHLLQIRREGAPRSEQIDQEGRRTRLEPERTEVALLEQQQQVEGVVDRLAGPVVAVVPGADLLTIQSRKLRREHRIHVGVGIAADRRIGCRHRDVAQVVQSGKQADLAELGYPGEHGETDMGVGILDHRVQVTQTVTDLAGALGASEIVEDRLVIFVDQHHHPLATHGVSMADQFGENAGQRLALAGQAQSLLLFQQQLACPLFQRCQAGQHSATKADAHHRKTPAPVPFVMDLQAAKQWIVAREQLGQGVDEQALAKTRTVRPGYR